jgi:hypothetical protein
MANKKTVASSKASLSTVYHLWAWILLAWCLYRYFIKLPEWADEFIFKPLVFVAPVIWYVRNKEKQSIATLGLTRRNFFTSVYIGLGCRIPAVRIFPHYSVACDGIFRRTVVPRICVQQNI